MIPTPTGKNNSIGTSKSQELTQASLLPLLTPGFRTEERFGLSMLNYLVRLQRYRPGPTVPTKLACT
jgi:hypothetical protein